MRISHVKHITLDEEVPVYCMTTETSNFALENAVVVHNCGGLRKVRQRHQALLPLKGKILNCIKAKGDKALLSQAVLSILGALGFDPKQADPLKKLQIGKIIFLADADPDGPLHGNTRVKLLDGTTPTMKQLAARWLVDQTPIWVWGVTPEGATKPVQAILPRQVKVVNKLLKITFDDGTVVKCTPNHKWAVNYSSHTIGAKTSSVHHVKAQYLSPGDSVVGVDFDHTGRKSRKYQRLRVDGKMVRAHQHIKQVLEPRLFAKYQKLNKGSGYGGAVHIHHRNDNPLDNSPENLKFIYKETHGRHHMREYAEAYNGSDKHLADLEKHWSSKAGTANRKQARDTITAYNQSEKHRQTVRDMNSDPEQVERMRLGKCARYLNDLHAKGKTLGDWDTYRRNSLPRLENLQFSENEMLSYLRTSKKTILSERLLKPTKTEYPTQKITKFIRMCGKVQDAGMVLTRKNYGNLRATLIAAKEIPQGTPKWDTCYSLVADSYEELRELVQRERTNHKVVSVKEIDAPGTPVYCMTVPETSNFLLEDKNGNGIASGNSHINCLLHVLIARYLPGMYDAGMVYVADMPEFYSIVKDQIFTGDKLSEVQAKLKKAKLKGDVLHAKGWGEVDPQVLKILAVDNSRRLIKINPLTDEDKTKFFGLMGKGEAPSNESEE